MEPRCCCCRASISLEDCPYLRDGDEELLFNRKERFLQRCLGCPRFLQNMSTAPHEGCAAMGELFPYAVEALLSQRAENRSLSGQIEAKSREVKFLHEVSLVLQTSVDMDEVIAMALTAVTAGQGFGLNRAILMLVDKERQFLRGYFAVGPRRPEEASHIWREIEEHDYTLREMARLFFEQKMSAERERFRDLLDILSVPLNRSDHLFVNTLNEQVSRHVRDLFLEPGIDRPQAEALGVPEMILVPLISQSRRIGLLLADNIINRKPITNEDISSLETFALPLSFAIERAALYGRLRDELSKLIDANRRLREQQEMIVRMEKMALVGSLTANIAHSIRNPLTIIGGYARNLIRSTPPEDNKRQFIESIVREARRLEEALHDVLNYSESLHPTLDLWDVNQLIAAVYTGLRDDLEVNRIDCRLDFAQDLPLVHLDYKMISYCLRSLLRTILEASPADGRLTIGTERVGDELRVVITARVDIDAETVRSLAHPFTGAEATGSCLGLSLCTRILEEHAAAFDIDSQPGRDTTFTIRLRIPREEEHAQTADR